MAIDQEMDTRMDTVRQILNDVGLDIRHLPGGEETVTKMAQYLSESMAKSYMTHGLNKPSNGRMYSCVILTCSHLNFTFSLFCFIPPFVLQPRRHAMDLSYTHSDFTMTNKTCL